jgi:hypothetical protein
MPCEGPARAVWLALMLFAGVSVLQTSKAQDALADSADLLPEKVVGVRDRPRPEYDPLGIRLGGFELTPSLNVEETYDDNIYATDHGLIDDFLTATTGSISVASQGQRPSVSATGSFTDNRYLHNSVENYLDFSGSAGLGYLFGSTTSLNATSQFNRTHVSRQTPNFPLDAITPPAVDTSGGAIGANHSFIGGDLRLNVQYLSFSFLDAKFANGIKVSQSPNDHDELTIDLRGDILATPTGSAFLHLIHKEYIYGNAPSGTLSRDSTVDTAAIGATFLLTNLMKGEIGVGALRLRDHEAVDNSLTTVSVRSNLEFFVSQLVTATATLERAEGPSNIAGSSNFISTSAGGVLDYEFRRNVILSATFSRDYRIYTGVNASETTIQTAARARWLLNRSLTLDFAYTLSRRNSRVPQQLPLYLGENFTDQAVDVEVELAL